jgi:hypothetical protein
LHHQSGSLFIIAIIPHYAVNPIQQSTYTGFGLGASRSCCNSFHYPAPAINDAQDTTLPGRVFYRNAVI